jgi:hypothetical protein
MTRITTIVDGHPMAVSPDALPPRRDALWAMAIARVIDEITNRPIDSALAATVEEPRLLVRLGKDGRVGVLVEPWDRYPLLARPFDAHVRLSATGFLPRRLTFPIVRALGSAVAAGATVITLDNAIAISTGQQWQIGDPAAVSELVTVAAPGPGANQVTLSAPLVNGYAAGLAFAPAALTSIDLGDVALHRRGVVVRGRVMVFDAPTQRWQPPASATLDMTYTWKRQADVTNEFAKEVLHMVSITPGLYQDRTATADVLQPVDVINVPGDEKTLLQPLMPNNSSARVSNAKGLAAGITLQLDVDHPDVTEILPLSAFVPTGTADEPATVDFTMPVAIEHRAASGIRHVTTPTVLAAKALDADGLVGDPVVSLINITFGGTPTTARIGAGPAQEFQRVALFSTTTDSDGYFEFPPLSRVAKVRIAATIPPKPPQQIDLQPDYRSIEQWVAVNVV